MLSIEHFSQVWTHFWCLMLQPERRRLSEWTHFLFWWAGTGVLMLGKGWLMDCLSPANHNDYLRTALGKGVLWLENSILIATLTCMQAVQLIMLKLIHQSFIIDSEMTRASKSEVQFTVLFITQCLHRRLQEENQLFTSCCRFLFFLSTFLHRRG